MKNRAGKSPDGSARMLDGPRTEKHVLRLYVTGMTPRSTEAVARIKILCEQHLAGRYELDVIDIYQQPARAMSEQIIATPTLIKSLPLPLRRLVGDLSDQGRVLRGLDVQAPWEDLS